jgi:hypothetical protein
MQSCPRVLEDEESLRTRVDILRQMLLLALGASHPCYRDIDDAWLSGNLDRMREALDSFENLPEEEKVYVLGLGHGMDEITGSD